VKTDICIDAEIKMQKVTDQVEAHHLCQSEVTKNESQHRV